MPKKNLTEPPYDPGSTGVPEVTPAKDPIEDDAEELPDDAIHFVTASQEVEPMKGVEIRGKYLDEMPSSPAPEAIANWKARGPWPATEPGRKDDLGKLRFDLLPAAPVQEIVKVLTFGCAKYGPNNWQNVEDPIERYYAAAMRHLNAWRLGERNDPESGIHHLAHAGCSVLFLLWFSLRVKE